MNTIIVKRVFIALLLMVTSILNADILILHSSKTGKPKPSNIPTLEKIQKAADLKGIKVTLKGLPWNRALKMLKLGKADAVVNASFKEDRAEYAVYPRTKNGELDSSRRLNPGKSYYIYKNKNSTISWDGKVFKNPDGPVGAVEKFAVIKDLEVHKNIEIRTMTSKISLLRAVYSGQLAAYAGAGVDVDSLLKKSPKFSDKIVKEEVPIRKKEYFLVFSKQFYKANKQVAESLWDGLREVD